MSATVVADSLSKRFSQTVALDSVSLVVETGEIFALVGPNGAGKTTLVRTLTGTTTPTSGTVRMFGTSPQQADRSRLGLLPQSFVPPQRLSARELLAYYAGQYEEARDIDELLSTVGLDGVGDTRYSDLSGGQQRRVCVGLTLVNDPALLFLDEPTMGIDPAGRQALWAVLTDLADDGTTVFLTTHYMEEAARLADRVAFLDDGELVATGTPAELINRYGGPRQLFVETDAAASVIGDLGFAVQRLDDGLLTAGISPSAIGDIVDTLEARGIDYDRVEWSKPTLEDVYLRLTGDDSTGSETGIDSHRSMVQLQ